MALKDWKKDKRAKIPWWTTDNKRLYVRHTEIHSGCPYLKCPSHKVEHRYTLHCEYKNYRSIFNRYFKTKERAVASAKRYMANNK